MPTLRVTDGIGKFPLVHMKMNGAGTVADPGKLERDVNVQDQATATVILPLVQVLATTTLSVLAVKGAYTCTLTSVTGVTIGNHIRIFEALTDRYYSGTILNIVGNVITLDSPLDFAFPSGSVVTVSNKNMAVNGSVTPVHFHLRTGAPSIPSNVDITRIIMVCQCTTAVALNKFANLTALTRGILLRLENEETGVLRNVFNVKSNAELAGLAYDWTPYSASNPAQDVDGFSWRLTFAGQEKIGVVLRVDQYGQLGMLIQDDLSTLTSLFCVVEGHVVD